MHVSASACPPAERPLHTRPDAIGPASPPFCGPSHLHPLPRHLLDDVQFLHPPRAPHPPRLATRSQPHYSIRWCSFSMHILQNDHKQLVLKMSGALHPDILVDTGAGAFPDLALGSGEEDNLHGETPALSIKPGGQWPYEQPLSSALQDQSCSPATHAGSSAHAGQYWYKLHRP